jgi:zinc D-Ala-D-Ala dipeptidase
MLTLAHPSIERMNCKEGGDHFVNLAGLHGRISIDMSRQLITSTSRYFSWIRRDVSRRLIAAAERLPSEFRILVIEGYRPLAVQRRYFHNYSATLRQANPDVDNATLYEMVSKWVAPPAVAGHPAGAAIDLTLQLANGGHVDMGSVVNANDAESTGTCYTENLFVSREVARNRAILSETMTAAGFINYPSEWWHWSYGDRYWAVVTGAPHAIYGPVEEDLLDRTRGD